MNDRLFVRIQKTCVIVIAVLVVISLMGISGWLWFCSQGVVIPFWKFAIHPIPVVPMYKIL